MALGQALDLEAINALLGSSRVKGGYDAVLDEFLESGMQGVEVDLTSGELAGKDPKNVVTGFNNAKDKMVKETGKPRHPGGNLVRVIRKSIKDDAGNITEEHVFLINTATIGGGDGQAAPQEEPATA